MFYTNSERSELLQSYHLSLFDTPYDGWRDCWDGDPYKDQFEANAHDPRHL